MIKLEKLEEPKILADNNATWTEEYLKAKSNGTLSETIRNRYKHQDIKSRLLEETNGKCAYCETKLSDFNIEIEHIQPKSEYPEKFVEWENLTIGCSDCNRRKLDNVSKYTPILNPFIDNPSKFLEAVGFLILHRPGNTRGEITHKLLGLNEARLLERRKERILNLCNLVDKYAITKDGLMKKILKRELLKEMENDKEFTFVVTAYIKPRL